MGFILQQLRQESEPIPNYFRDLSLRCPQDHPLLWEQRLYTQALSYTNSHVRFVTVHYLLVLITKAACEQVAHNLPDDTAW